MQGKIALITGATEGIGKYTALELARLGALVVIVGRNPAKTANVLAWLRQSSGNPDIYYLLADLSNQTQIRALAVEFHNRFERLDVLVNNVGALFIRRQLSADGIEMTFALNHLSHFLLTHLLMDMLAASKPARIVNMSSIAHHLPGMNFNDLQGKRFYNGWLAYNQSKLANLLFTYELARRLDPGLTANSLHPGYVATHFAQNNGTFYERFFNFSHLVAKSPEAGSHTLVYLASSPDVEGVTGRFFINCRPAASSRASHDLQAAQCLWQVSEAMTGASQGLRSDFGLEESVRQNTLL